MADSRYNFASGGPGYPEPPVRPSAEPLGQDPQDLETPTPVFERQESMFQVDTSGLDSEGDIARRDAYSPIASSDLTESFAQARKGDTASMPAVAKVPEVLPDPAVGFERSSFSPASSLSQSGAIDMPQAQPAVEEEGRVSQLSGTLITDSHSRQSSAVAGLESGYAFDPSPAASEPSFGAGQASPYDRGEAAAYTAPAANATGATSFAGAAGATRIADQERASAGTVYSRQASHADSRTSYVASASNPKYSSSAKKSGGGFKTFLCGFLGAALACGLAFGGNALLNANSKQAETSSAPTSVHIGTTDQSVIDAVGEGQTLAEAVAAKALPSVVAIYNYQEQPSSYGFGFGYGNGIGPDGQSSGSLVQAGMGSGVVISDEGYIVTNYHVVEDNAKLTVSVNGVERDASYIGGDSSSDIAVIKVEDTKGLVTADIGDSDNLKIGEWVMTVGAPLGLESSVATGVVSATNRSTIMSSASNTNDIYSYIYGNQGTPEYTYYPNMIQTDAVINPGNSGGALVDANGKLIGINAMISSYSGDYAGVGFAIPINYAVNIANKVIAGEEPTHAMIGVSLSQVNSQIAQQYNLSSDTGAYVSAITPDTGAAQSDLAVGDIITKVNGKTVKTTTDVTLEVRAHSVGDEITLTVNRNGEEMEIPVTLSSDEILAQTKTDSADGQDSGEGEQGSGGGNGYNLAPDELEELLKMFNL